jgi:hypothetical protein
MKRELSSQLIGRETDACARAPTPSIRATGSPASQESDGGRCATRRPL